MDTTNQYIHVLSIFTDYGPNEWYMEFSSCWWYIQPPNIFYFGNQQKHPGTQCDRKWLVETIPNWNLSLGLPHQNKPMHINKYDMFTLSAGSFHTLSPGISKAARCQTQAWQRACPGALWASDKWSDTKSASNVIPPIIWRFPKMGVPHLSSILMGFSLINHPF